MANELNNNKRVDEGYTEFASPQTQGGPFYAPVGRFSRFFAKFFATKAAPYVAKENEGDLYDTGDTVINREAEENIEPASPSRLKSSLKLPEIEYARRNRYRDYEIMDEYPEIGAAFDIYADDSTQVGVKNEHWTIVSDNKQAVNEVEEMFRNISLDRFIWDITRNTVKYGDCFTELVVDLNNPKKGVQKVKVLDPKYLLRVENQYGYLERFYQEIPQKGRVDNFGIYGYSGGKSQFIELDKNQIIHFRLHTSDPTFYPYGKSIAALCHRTFRSLKLMEDAMMIYRLSRAPERRVFYIDVGNLPASKSEMFIERLKEKFKKEKFYDQKHDTIDSRYNPMSADEDFFVPVRGNGGTKIDTLPGAQNLSDVEDVRYFRDKLLAALKVPKDYIVEKDKSPERKANLSQLDVKFSRTIVRMQQSVAIGLEAIAKRHLQLRGFPASIIEELRIRLPEPSDMFAKRKLDLDMLKTQVIGAVQALQLFPKEQLYKEYYNYTDAEIAEIEQKIGEDQEKEAEKMQMAGGPAPAEGGPATTEGAEQDTVQDAGGGLPPTTNESITNFLEESKLDLLKEGSGVNWKQKALTRVIKKLKNQEEDAVLGTDETI